MRKHFLITILTLAVIGGFAAVAIFLAKGYRMSPQSKTIFGTGIMSIASTPDQASVYLDGHLTTATNANINSLEPKTYEVKIVKEGFIPWQKKIEIKQGLVTEVKASLFPAIPTIYPLSFNGAVNVLVSTDNQRVAFVVPGEGEANPLSLKKGGVWVWDMKDQPVSFARGREPHQILSAVPGLDLTEAKLKWSPDSNQVLVQLSDRNILLDANRLNDNPRDITAILNPTLQEWDTDLKTSNSSRVQTIKDPVFKKVASASAYLKWSPDETKVLYAEEDKFKVRDLLESKSFDLPEVKAGDGVVPFSWLADSRHLVMVETEGAGSRLSVAGSQTKREATSYSLQATDLLVTGTISVIEFDGANKSVMFAGKFDPVSVFSWPDYSRLVMISSVPTPTGSTPNLFGLNLK